MRLLQLVSSVTLLLLSSCYQVCTTEGMMDSSNCKKGHVIMFSCCTGTTFIEMSASAPIGKDIVAGETTYHNAIQVVGEFKGDVSLKLREFDHDQDEDKIGRVCYCLMAESWASLPMYVVELTGATDCSATE